MGLFLNVMNTATGLGIASISLAFAFGQLWWGLTQPLAGIVADRIGAGRVLVAGIVLVAIGTALVPHMTSTAGLIFAIGVLAAGGAGMAGPSVLMAATARLVAPEKRGIATGVVNAGGSFGQFVFAPISQAVTATAGRVAALADAQAALARLCRRFPRRVARRQGLRVDRPLRLDVVRRHRARRRCRADPPADQGAARAAAAADGGRQRRQPPRAASRPG
jgi:MFS family permease